MTQPLFNKHREAAIHAFLKSICETGDASELTQTHDTLVDLLDCDVSPDHVILAFTLLPDRILFEGMKWGFNDSGVRDEVYTYIDDHLASFRQNFETLQNVKIFGKTPKEEK